jgi:hypothetical protein
MTYDSLYKSTQINAHQQSWVYEEGPARHCRQAKKIHNRLWRVEIMNLECL